MKAEINNKNKEKFFAQYWGQNIFDGGHSLRNVIIGGWIDRSKAWLKPLSSISDEDALELSKFFNIDKCSRAFKIGYMKSELKNINNLKGSIYDCLRSKGYAVPWMGLEVEEMVEAGWIKLIEG